MIVENYLIINNDIIGIIPNDNVTEIFMKADEEWQACLARECAGIVNARYLPSGKGEPGSLLRKLYDRREAAYIDWENIRKSKTPI